jgi:hypothetical protein
MRMGCRMCRLIFSEALTVLCERASGRGGERAMSVTAGESHGTYVHARSRRLGLIEPVVAGVGGLGGLVRSAWAWVDVVGGVVLSLGRYRRTEQ